MNKPWILANAADGKGGSLLLEADGANGLHGRFATISYPGANFGATSFTGLEGESNAYIIDNFSFLAGQHSFKTGVQLSRQTMFMDVEASHKGRWGFRRTATWIYWEMYNALNTDNYFGFQGSLQSSIFSKATTELPKRRQQFGLRFDF